MNEVIAIRIDPELRKHLDRVGKYTDSDTSRVVRLLIQKGYSEFVKEQAAQEYIEGKITLSEAAHRGELTLWEMEHYLVDKGYTSSYSIEDLQEELNFLDKKK